MNPKLQLAGKAAQVGALGLFEKLRPPVLRSRDDVPMSGADLTTEWLTEVLCRDIPGAQVVSFSTPGGSSGTSERLALRVEYNDAGIAAVLPTQLYTKTTKSFRQRMVLGGAGAIAGESHFYMRLRDKSTIEARPARVPAAVIWPYTAWAFTIGRAAYQPEMQPVDTCLSVLRRTSAAIDDLDSFGAIGL
jgi:hypothetical protein